MSRAAPGAGLTSADFERLLATRPCACTEHFVLHHQPRAAGFPAAELSTASVSTDAPHVDDLPRLGLIVPKRHARRAVTRTLIKRQGRAMFADHATRLRPGDWVLRLRSPYAKPAFVSASSPALRSAVRGELQTLFATAAGGAR